MTKIYLPGIRAILYFVSVFSMLSARAQIDHNMFPVYNGTDLGVTYSPAQTSFRVWAPTASAVVLRLYNEGIKGQPAVTDSMKKDKQGTWVSTLKGDFKNKFYTFQVKTENKWLHEVTDIYAKAVGVNGKRGMIVDLKETNPEGWEKDKKPLLRSYNDIIIWEIHTRDLSVHPSSGIKQKGKFLGFTEKGTKSPSGEKTGLDHIVDLGVTHIHLLPAFDFRTVDETQPDKPQFNWGYDPQNYNVPEGSYSTDPYDGKVRIREFKQMVKTMHDNGLRVILDVVYNHTSGTDSIGFEQLVPGYYYRMTKENKFSDGSGCGNETASDHPMMRKFITESVRHWASEYHIDGFRFDLMALHDIETMNGIRKDLDKIDSTIFIYGEGWMAGGSTLPDAIRATKAQAGKLDRIAVFSDEIRDAIHGPYNNPEAPGFICGVNGLEESLEFGIAGGVKHPDVNYEKVNYTKSTYVNEPSQTIVYASCHDDPSLWDRIQISCKGITEKESIQADKLANAIVLTSQGVPFIHAGEEIVRTKQLVHNSYNKPDSINNFDWTRKTKYKDVYTYYKQLISLRKNHPAFRMPTTAMIARNLHFLDIQKPLMVGFQLSNNANGDQWKNILVFFNANKEDTEVSLPEGDWRIVANGDVINEKGLSDTGFNQLQKGTTGIPGRSMLILVDKVSIKN